MKQVPQDAIIGKITGAMTSVPRFIRIRQAGHFLKADAECGRRVAEGLGLKLSEVDSRMELGASKT